MMPSSRQRRKEKEMSNQRSSRLHLFVRAPGNSTSFPCSRPSVREVVTCLFIADNIDGTEQALRSERTTNDYKTALLITIQIGSPLTNPDLDHITMRGGH